MDPVENDQNAAGPAPEAAPVSAAPTAENNRTVMGVLAYISVLVLIPYFTAKNDPFVQFHVRQGFVLLAIEVLVYIAANLMIFIAPIWLFVQIATIVLSIIGIINVIQGKEKELPFVGAFAKHFSHI